MALLLSIYSGKAFLMPIPNISNVAMFTLADHTNDCCERVWKDTVKVNAPEELSPTTEIHVITLKELDHV